MELLFPIRGLHKGFATEKQPQGTSLDMNNVRPYDPLGNRLRGGQRPPLDKWSASDLVSPIVAICSVSTVE